MSEANNELKRDLECLRLASDFIRLSRETLNAELRAHCDRMATFWTGQAERNMETDLTVPEDLDT